MNRGRLGGKRVNGLLAKEGHCKEEKKTAALTGYDCLERVRSSGLGQKKRAKGQRFGCGKNEEKAVWVLKRWSPETGKRLVGQVTREGCRKGKARREWEKNDAKVHLAGGGGGKTGIRARQRSSLTLQDPTGGGEENKKQSGDQRGRLTVCQSQ